MEKNRINASGCVVIGGSAGSFKALMNLLPLLRPPLSPILMILHRKNDFESSLALLFSAHCGLRVKEAEDKEFLMGDTIYIAPPDYHLLVEEDGSLSLDRSEKVLFSRPSIDVTFLSAADAFGPRLMAVLLSGANGDGALGMKAVQKAGGATLVQDPKEAELPAMPKAALALISPTYIKDSLEMATIIRHFCAGLT